MESALKQRLIGGFALMALAVIFLPVLLDGSGHQARLDMNRAIPPEPEFPQPEPVQQAAAGRPASSSGQAPGTPAQSGTATDSAPGNQARERTPTRSEARPADSATPPPTARQPPAQAATPPPAPAASQPPSQAQPGAGWVVQVGSFSQEANARREAERLTASGFKAFVEAAQAGGNTVYRVKLGPETERRRAEQLRDRLRQQGGVTGIVMSQP